ncbi:hypothetical protein [Marinospirillum sp.]|uniref:hypothetical protein n=1 Tax=Marinospirillum sp. TaxID=2183934 RepID=UPI00286FB686|nr:hypothetical protein [Marinospirillum sp.]MDR9466876.1 hypothetical protein [Marinospirillum sp.]
MSNSDAPYVEVVQPDDGRHESLGVWTVILGVVLLGGLGVFLRQEAVKLETPRPHLDVQQRQLEMELSIALQEMEFLGFAAAEESAARQQLLLQEEGLLPYFPGQSADDWVAVEPGCFYLQKPGSTQAFAFQFLNQGSHLYFTNQFTGVLPDCQQLDSWFVLDTAS